MIWQLFHTDPADANGAFVRPRAIESERKLRVAVLTDALDKIADPPPPGSAWKTVEHYERDCQWLASTSTAHPFAFVPLCEALGLDPDAVRRAVRLAAAAEIALTYGKDLRRQG